MFRSRSLLDLAHRLHSCANCGAYSVDGLEPAHSNLPEHGKGVGLKAHDCFHAALCPSCHRWLDNQGGHRHDPSGLYEPTKEGKRAMFTRAMHITILDYHERGWLQVNNAKAKAAA